MGAIEDNTPKSPLLSNMEFLKNPSCDIITSGIPWLHSGGNLQQRKEMQGIMRFCLLLFCSIGETGSTNIG